MKWSLKIPKKTFTENQVCAARRRLACEFFSAHIWALCVLKNPSLVKDASSTNNTLRGNFRTHSKLPMFKSNKRCLTIWLQCLNMLHVKWMHVVFSENLQTLLLETLIECARLSILLLGELSHLLQFDGRNPCYSYPLSDSSLKWTWLS